MRTPFFIALLISLSVGATYWYQSQSYLCPVPVAYQLAEIDESFSITTLEARSAITDAVTLWEEAAERDLFVYDEQADLRVAFVFDDRQATADAQASQEARLDAVARENESLRQTITELQSTYERLEVAFTERKEAYDSALAAYNQEVRQVNDQGGADTDTFVELEAKQQSLEVEADTLREQAVELNAVAEQLNSLSSEGNELVERYNQEVRQYNAEFTGGEESTQGDYTGDAITIYKFSNRNELVTVLAHEFGHA
ncbi:MAG TPA: hypothetical protein VKP88_07500, partial [Candidatus Paceibacterota bacterium]|nr:hypothetical protein [Candidatus Paceibacterota bacterium]